ncbi:sulfite exporter TauE/SafE family protein [Sphingobacteriales bacterium UPWRP_1]|nr:hypothetical protein B6N25_05615 [Sphingobacteriales bacterium TSM_CSS]PSJ78367.1 sulfite exporter TauE/SafE family protein [Sphingobacteriales bacterium UPWRP_1]
MFTISDILLLLLSGILGGFVGGYLGIGGSPVYIVFFSYFIHQFYGTQVSPEEAVQLTIANTVFARTFASLAGCWKHYVMHNFYTRTVVTIAIPATIFSLLFAWLMAKFHYSKTAFSLAFIAMFMPLIYKMLTDDAEKKVFNHPYRIKVVFLNLAGVVSGALTALSGLGTGFILIPLLNSLFNIKIRKVTSISLGVLFITSLFTSIYYALAYHIGANLPFTYGGISLLISMPVLVGSLVASPVGVKVSQQHSPRTIRIVFIVFCVLITFNELVSLIRSL